MKKYPEGTLEGPCDYIPRHYLVVRNYYEGLNIHNSAIRLYRRDKDILILPSNDDWDIGDPVEMVFHINTLTRAINHLFPEHDV